MRPHGLYSPWNSRGQNTRVGSLSLLQAIFPTQGSDSGFLCCREILYQLSHKGSPRILEWEAYPFSSRSSWPRNQTGISCTAGEFFTNWAMREAPPPLKAASIQILKHKWKEKGWHLYWIINKALGRRDLSPSLSTDTKLTKRSLLSWHFSPFWKWVHFFP